MKHNIQVWLRGLASAVITGLTTSFMTALGISGAEAIGIKIEQLQPKQLVMVTLIGGAVGAAAYLKQSPLPLDDSEAG